ncbi:MAG: YihY/virulence factor BrkB family protein [Anaerolineae bacterium]|nr:YihY/virulence factor BrkB family protein [Anaerolineae bacterium]
MLTQTCRTLDRRSRGGLGVLRRAGQGYAKAQAAQAAAALAYYVFFSLFPLLFILVYPATFIWNLGTEQAFESAVEFISQAIPVSQELIRDSLERIIDRRGTVGLIGLVGALWSSSSAFTILTHDINEAFHGALARGVVKKRLMGILMVVAIVLLLLLSLGTTAMLRVLSQMPLVPQNLIFLETVVWATLLRVIPLMSSFLLFLALFQWVPAKRVHWRAALSGAGLAALAWELAKSLFSWYLASGLASYTIIYGSLSSVIVLLFWIYISATIALFGAHLTAAMDEKQSEGAVT